MKRAQPSRDCEPDPEDAIEQQYQQKIQAEKIVTDSDAGAHNERNNKKNASDKKTSTGGPTTAKSASSRAAAAKEVNKRARLRSRSDVEQDEGTSRKRQRALTDDSAAEMAPATKNISKYKAGDLIWVFTTEERDYDAKNHVAYIAVLDHRHGNFRPRTGLSEGWVPAVVTHDFAPEKYNEKKRDTHLQFEFTWPHWFNCRGAYLEKHQLYYYAQPDFVASREDVAIQKGLRGRQKPFLYRGGQFEPDFQPELAIVAFRWGGRDIPDSDPGELLGITNRYLYKLCDDGLRPTLGRKYEIWSVFVEDRHDCENLANSLHLIFGDHHPCRRAKNVVSMFFLQPTGFDTESEPALMTGDENGAGSLEYESLYKLIRASERCGMVTRFPHSAHFYQILTNKEWTHQLCLNPKYRIPASIAVPRMWIERDVAITAAKARKMLQMVRDKQTALGMCPAKKIVQGVGKLGYSWEALDVKLWREDVGNYNLVSALNDLTQQIEITSNFVGQAHTLDHVIVQEFVHHATEMRLYFVENKCEFVMFTKFGKIKANQEFGDFNYLTKDQVLATGFHNDKEALDKAIEMGKETARELLDWVRTQTLDDEIPALRFDFFLQYEQKEVHKMNNKQQEGLSKFGVEGYGLVGNSKASSSSSSSSSSSNLPDQQQKSSSGASKANGGGKMNNSTSTTAGSEQQSYSNQWVNPANSAVVTVNVLEMCELGFSILHNKAIPRAVMPAIVRSCLNLDQVESNSKPGGASGGAATADTTSSTSTTGNKKAGGAKKDRNQVEQPMIPADHADESEEFHNCSSANESGAGANKDSKDSSYQPPARERNANGQQEQKRQSGERNNSYQYYKKKTPAGTTSASNNQKQGTTANGGGPSSK
ncbi:unnamed protein product [Amoebophrya sp. A120]|nr:unnamed protein product [Amoebophrya sp. A120]|eukprot:GSA120T00001230001.1